MRVLKDGRPISHVAAEGGVSRNRLSVWVQRYIHEDEAGLVDRSSRPARSPSLIDPAIEKRIEEMRREKKWGPDRIQGELMMEGIVIGKVTVWRALRRLGISRLRDIDGPTGANKRHPNTYEMTEPGRLIHMDVTKVGKIPIGGGWRVHGRGSEAAKASQRKGNKKAGYTCFHVAIDDHSRIVYIEAHNNERTSTVIEFFDRALAFFASHGFVKVVEVMTDNGPAYTSHGFAKALVDRDIRHHRIPGHTPEINGKVERFNGTFKREYLYASVFTSEEERREGVMPFVNYYNHDRPHSKVGNRPPVTRAPVPGERLIEAPIAAVVIPSPDFPGQMSLDLGP